MGLKTIHLVFVGCALVLALAFGAWCVQHYRTQGDPALLALGIASFVLGGALVVYAPWFLRKLQRIGYQ